MLTDSISAQQLSMKFYIGMLSVVGYSFKLVEINACHSTECLWKLIHHVIVEILVVCDFVC